MRRAISIAHNCCNAATSAAASSKNETVCFYLLMGHAAALIMTHCPAIGDGLCFDVLAAAVNGGRVNIAACSVGGAQFCLDYTSNYVKERKQFGRALEEFQNTQFKLADMATGLQASRLMVKHAAQSLDSKVRAE